jgi:GH43 family beta-xylosidase
MSTTYTNPVFDRYMADPFVLRHENVYYAYGTGPHGPDGMQFPVLRSRDLATWEAVGWALRPVQGADQYWAPEVIFNGGRFYLYYSAHGIAGHDHQLRAAVSPVPTGPFDDCGIVLTPDDPFTIDAHPFRDVDNRWYLFYARDFLTLDGDWRVGTGIVADRLLDMTTLAGDPHVVVRPHADWHLFQAQRPMYGRVYDWHTVEGPAMLLHNGRYYCFYSGGAWEKSNYGVSYVVADHLLGPYRRPALDGPLLRSNPATVIGPGHNSFTRSLNGTQEFIVYHAWPPDMSARQMRLDRLTWHGDEPVIHGPTWTPQLF